MNEDFELGSMLPFIDVCKRLSIPVLVMNPNFSTRFTTGMREHATFVWNRYVKNSGFNKIEIVAHSAGGGCVGAIIEENQDTFFD